MTIGLTLRRTARKISRLNEVGAGIPSAYFADQTPGLLLLSGTINSTAKFQQTFTVESSTASGPFPFPGGSFAEVFLWSSAKSVASASENIDTRDSSTCLSTGRPEIITARRVTQVSGSNSVTGSVLKSLFLAVLDIREDGHALAVPVLGVNVKGSEVEQERSACPEDNGITTRPVSMEIPVSPPAPGNFSLQGKSGPVLSGTYTTSPKLMPFGISAPVVVHWNLTAQ